MTKRSHKAKLAMARSKKQKADQEYDSDTTIIDCHCAEVCDCRDVYRDVESSKSLLLFATTRSVFKSVKISVVEIAKRTN